MDVAERQRQAFERTLRVYETLVERVEAAVGSGKIDGSENWALSRDERATLVEMVKLLGSVLEFERKYFKDERSAPGRAPLDLDAARAEIARRLDRLLAAGGA